MLMRSLSNSIKISLKKIYLDLISVGGKAIPRSALPSNSIKISPSKIYLDLMGNFCGWQGDFSVALSELLAAALRYRIKSVG